MGLALCFITFIHIKILILNYLFKPKKKEPCLIGFLENIYMESSHIRPKTTGTTCAYHLHILIIPFICFIHLLAMFLWHFFPPLLWGFLFVTFTMFYKICTCVYRIPLLDERKGYMFASRGQFFLFNVLTEACKIIHPLYSYDICHLFKHVFYFMAMFVLNDHF